MTVEVLRYASGENIRVDDEVVEMVNGNRHGRVVEVLQPDSDQARCMERPGGGITVEWNDDSSWVFFPPYIITGPDYLYFLARKGDSAEGTVRRAVLELVRDHPEWTNRRIADAVRCRYYAWVHDFGERVDGEVERATCASRRSGPR